MHGMDASRGGGRVDWSVCLSVRMGGDRLSVPKDKLLHTYIHTDAFNSVLTQ